MPWFHRMDFILSSLDSIFLDPSPVEHVILEGYAYGGSFKGFVLGELGGLIKYHFQKQHSRRVIQILAGHHKMYIANNYTATKQDTINCLRSRFGIDTRDDNIADAISMALLYRHILTESNPEVPTSEYEKLLFEKVRLSIGRAHGEIAKKPRKRKKAKTRRIEVPDTCNTPNPFEAL